VHIFVNRQLAVLRRGRVGLMYRLGASISELTHGRLAIRPGDRGATAVEYGLMVTLIAVVIVVAVAAFGVNVSKLFLVPASVFTP